jgi:hypothetical protein
MDAVKNYSIEQENIWMGADGLQFRELISQAYSNCKFTGGEVLNHSVDQLYLAWEKDDGAEGGLLLRPDEVAALAWVLTGLLWSFHLSRGRGADASTDDRE